MRRTAFSIGVLVTFVLPPLLACRGSTPDAPDAGATASAASSVAPAASSTVAAATTTAAPPSHLQPHPSASHSGSATPAASSSAPAAKCPPSYINECGLCLQPCNADADCKTKGETCQPIVCGHGSYGNGCLK